jgi:DNA repair protein RadC
MNTKIMDMPCADRPREKLARFGPTALDNAELMALFLSTGTKGRSAIDIGRDLIARHGSLGALGSLPIDELMRHSGLGPAKASKLAAAFELGARVAREQVQHIPLDSPERLYDYFAPQLRHLSQEQLIVVLLDTRLRHSGTTIISQGTVDSCHAHPRDILRPVVARGCYGFAMVHNHPSGDCTPSNADHRTTCRIREAAELMQLVFLDHVIIGRPTPGRQPYYSFREAGIIRPV